METPIIETRGLKKYFNTPKGQLHAVDDVNLKIMPGETLGIVGESGCGKSTLGRLLVRLLEPTEGQILYQGKDITDFNRKDMKAVRKDIQIIFQDPYASLNPRMTVGDIIGEPLYISGGLSKKDIQRRVKKMADYVGVSTRLINAYPHELDGGRRQRVGIARALALGPKFIVCDEPVSALDVSIQAQILNLLMDLKDEMNLSYLFITHDLSVVKHISDKIAVMYLGQCVEYTSSDALFEGPSHPYTKALLSAIPKASLQDQETFEVLKGEITSPINPPPGCRFKPRCQYYSDSCGSESYHLSKVRPEHYAACYGKF